MKIITRYIIKEFLKPLVFSTVAFGGLVMISEFFRELNFYLERKAPFLSVFQYLFLNLPWWTIQVLPVAVLLAVLFSLGELAKRGEITALKAAGVNPWRIVGVLFLCGLAIGGVEILLRERVIPPAVEQAESIRRHKIDKDSGAARAPINNLVVSIPPDARMTIGSVNAAERRLDGVVIDYYGEDFQLLRQLMAKEARWLGKKTNAWELSAGVERRFVGRQWIERVFETMSIPLPFKPEDFMLTRFRPEQLSSRAYLDYLRQLRTLGIPTDKEQIQFHLRWSSAFSHVVVMLIGIPFALGLGSRHGKIMSFSFALIFAFIYWGFQAAGQSLGENRVMSHWLSAWLGNIVFAVAGLALLRTVKK